MKELVKNTRKVNVYPRKKMLSIVNKVCDLYSTGDYTLASVCETAGVPYRTYKHWWDMYEKEGSKDGSRWAILAEVADLWTVSQSESKEIKERELIERAEQSLLKRVEGYYYEVDEAIFEMRKDKFDESLVHVGMKKRKKYCHPSLSAIQFVLKNLYPKKYGAEQLIESVSCEVCSKYKGLTLNELRALLIEAETHLNFLNSNSDKSYDELVEINNKLFNYIWEDEDIQNQ